MKRLIFISMTLFVLINLSGCAASLGSEQSISHQAQPAFSKKEKIANHSVSRQTQVGRYSSVTEGPTPAQVNPLLAVSTFTFNTSVYCVGDAIKQVLMNTGYRLSPHLSHDVKQTLTKSLPVTHRRLGPMKVQTVLEVLMGKEVYTLQRDPLHRLVNFTMKPSIREALGVEKNAK